MEVVRILAERGADINKALNDGRTPLYIASKQGHVDVVRILIERGADMNKARDDGRSPMQAATHNAHAEVIHLLQRAINQTHPTV